MNTNQQNKQLIWTFWEDLANARVDEMDRIIANIMDENVVWHGFDPIHQLNGRQAYTKDFWKVLLHSFPDLHRETHIFMGGVSNGRRDGNLSKDGNRWVSGTGYFHATFQKDYLGIPANGERVRIRWGVFYRIENQKIVEIFCLLDLIDLMQQVGLHVLPPSKGKDNIYPPPKAKDGILLDAQVAATSEYSLNHIRRFIFDGLNAFDQDDLNSMGMADYFHPNVQWYGPGGIGACLSFQEFEDFHQKPWLEAYPDRQVQDLDALIAEGEYTGAPGWAGVKATHTGTYLNHPATGNSIHFNGLDWWKRADEQYIENWVFVDMIHLFRQFGVDLFERLKQYNES
ncbi:MAG: ester cyclase [Bacteroidota bacterium]